MLRLLPPSQRRCIPPSQSHSWHTFQGQPWGPPALQLPSQVGVHMEHEHQPHVGVLLQALEGLQGHMGLHDQAAPHGGRYARLSGRACDGGQACGHGCLCGDRPRDETKTCAETESNIVELYLLGC